VTPATSSHWRPALGCLLLAGLFFWWLVGHRVDLLNDEGIYLDGARRIVAGQVPYRDFFALTGPGVFWNLAAAFYLLGLKFSSARLILVLDMALLAGGLFWLAAQLTSRRVAAVLTFGFCSFLAGNAGMLKVTHRWDSSALSLAAIVLLWAGLQRNRGVLFALAGIAAGYAAWITPSMLALPIAITLWLLLQSSERPRAVPFLAGIALVSAIAAAWLATNQALLPMIDHLLWTSRNYAGANRFAYGGIPGGYGALFKDAAGAEYLIRGAVVFFVALPALLPPIALVWLLPKHRSRLTILLVVCAAALLVSCLPRWDLDHLEYVEPLFLILAGAWLAQALPPRPLAAAAVMFTGTAAVFLFVAIAGVLQLSPLQTKRGFVRGSAPDVSQIEKMLTPLPAGDGVYIYSYLPTLYFFTDAVNPTRYSYLQPGMMTDNDELSVLTDLQRQPPSWVIYNELSIEELLRVFPSSDPKRLRLVRLETWLKENYKPANPAIPPSRGIELYSRITAPAP